MDSIPARSASDGACMTLTPTHRAEAFKVLDREGSIIETARLVSNALRQAGVDAAVIGGVAVVLHGHPRTTIDVDLYATDLRAASLALSQLGLTFDSDRREFRSGDVPVHLVTVEQLGRKPGPSVVVDGVTVVDLADLIDMKLRSGTTNLLRAQDLADVIGLIRARRLQSAFAARIDKPLRSTFRKLVHAVERDGSIQPSSDNA